MKKRYFLLTSLLLISLASCGEEEKVNPTDTESISITDTSTNSDSSSAGLNDEVITNEDYLWPFNENDAYKGTLDFSASTFVYDESLSLKIDDQKVDKLAKNNLNVVLYYETKGCNSDNANRAADYIYLNGKKLKDSSGQEMKLPSDGSKGIELDFNNLEWGQNYISVTIGGWWGAKELDYQTALTGSADDFYIGNVYFETSTKQIIKPSKMVFHKARKNSGIFNKYDMEYEDGKLYYIGDGWSGNIAYDGNPYKKDDDTPYDCPQKIDFYFDYEIPEAISSYSVDTSKYSDGSHKVSLFNVDDELVLQNHIIFDNTAPNINVNINDFAHINRKSKLEVSFNDADIVKEKEIYFDGIDLFEESVDLMCLTPGTHNLSMYAKDRAGNETYDSRSFYLEDYYNQEKPTGTTELSYTKESKTSGTNVYDEITISGVDKTKDIEFTYKGTSTTNEEIVISAYNVKTSKYDVVNRLMSGEEVNVKFKAENYTNNENKVLVKASTNYVSNGSNKLLWSSDTQYLPKDQQGDSIFHDINPFYKQLMNHVKSEYLNNNIGYYVHTGDIVDDNPQAYDDATLRYEWNIASEAFKVLDDANVPYGVSAGNHDVGTDIHNLDYSYFSEYFGIDRFSSNEQYAGALNNNCCHYDLITLGDYDFIILYLGFGIEATDETIAWANKVLKQYGHRNAIIATHGYLDGQGKHDTTIQAEDIYQKIVVPNSNVKFVFSGHTDGSYVIKQELNNDRIVYEVLNCYQFYQGEKYTNSHKINGYDCNGEGYSKQVAFANDTVTFKTYSPIVNKEVDPYNNGKKTDGTFEIDLMENDHQLTTNSFKAVQ